MDNIAQLGIKVDSSGIKQATTELSKLTNQSGKTETSITSLRNVFASIGAGALAKQFIDTSDKLNLLDARLKLATSSLSEFKSQQEKLLQISLQSYTAIEDTVTLFTKLNPALKQVGASTEQVNNVVATFVKGLQLGGSSAQEASSAILQFSQAMGSGVLRGEEFNAIAEASPKLMTYLAEGLGVAQSQLRKMAENGELTASKVSNALLKVKDTIDKDFATLPVTVAKAMTNLSTATSLMIQDIDKTLGATNALSGYITQLTDAINSLSPEELQEIVDLVKNSAIAFGTAATAITLAKGAMTLYTSSTNGAITATTLLKGTLNTIPFAIIVTGITAIATSLFSASEASDTLDKTLKSTSDELSKLTKNQLAYRQSLLSTEIEKQKSIVRWQEMKAGIKGFKSELEIKEQKSILDDEKTKLDDMLFSYQDLIDASNSFNKTKSGSKLIDSTPKRNEAEIIKIAGSEYAKYTLELEANIKKLKEQGATEAEIDAYRTKAVKEFGDKRREEELKASESMDKIGEKAKKLAEDEKKAREETSNAYTEIAQVGSSDYDNALVSIAEKTQKWIEAGVNVNDVLTTQKQLLEDLNVQQSLSSASDELSFLERKAQLMTDEYEKSKLLLEIKYAQSMIDIQSSDAPLEQKQMMIDKETELYNLTKERIELDRNTEFQDTIKTFQEDALERQIALNESMYEFGDSFDGIAKHISTASKAIINMNTIAIKGKKEESKLNEKYTKEFSKYANDELKTKELVGQYEKDNSELKQQQQDAEIAGYANLAGAMASAFEKGSTAAIAFTTLQATLGIASSWTAIAMAWASAPFPANMPAVAAATAGVLPIIANLVSMSGGGGSSGSGGSSGGGAKKPSQFEVREQQIEDLYTPMTDRLDRQIELLESIDKQGSASASSLQGAGITFKRDYELAVNNILKTLPNDVRGYGLDFNQQLAGAESRLGFNIADVNRIKKSGWDKSEKRIYTDFSSLSKDFNLLKVISDYFTTGDGAIAAWFGGASKLNIAANEIQTAIGDFTMGIVSSLDDMKTASNDFKSIYDEITGSMFYENKRLAQAYTDVEKLTKGTSLAEYLKNNIDQIDFLQQTFNSAVLETLLSQDPKDMAEQIKVLEKLQTETGLVFENGAKEALDFMESIKLVGEAMANTVENRKSLIDNLRDFVDSINSTIDKPTTFKDFSSSFNEMIDAIKLGGDNLEELGNNAINSAQSYLDTIAKNAKSSAEIEFAKKVISNKFEGVINAKDITLGTINDTLKISFNEDSVIVKALNDVKNELVYLNQLNTRQTANSNKTLQLQRASIA